MAIRQIPFLLIGFFTLIGATIGRMICGWACPIGWLQEMLYKIPSPKIKVKDGKLKYIKYFALVFLVIIIPFITGIHWWSRLCFVGTLEGGIPMALIDDYVRSRIGGFYFFKLGLTIFFLISFVFIKRMFCRFVCPLGAIYSFFNRHSLVKLTVDDTCTKCNRCERLCPMGIKVYEDPNSPECIRCLECLSCKHVHLMIGNKKILSKKEEPCVAK